MKIGIISDIHAHLQPLERALQIFEREGVDQIVCAGDLVDGGKDVNAVVACIRDLTIPCVQGNHDAEVLADPWRVTLPAHKDPKQHYRLSLATFEFVVNLPTVLRFTWEGKRICLAHGAPWACWQYVYPVSGRHIIQRVVDEATSDIVILGHTHTPMQLRAGDTYILNAGSLAYNRTNYEERTCGILTVPEFSFRIYDLASGYSSTLDTKIIPG